MNTEATRAGAMYYQTGNGALLVGDHIRDEFNSGEFSSLVEHRALGALDAPQEVPAGSHYQSGWGGYGIPSFSIRPDTWW